MEAAYEREGKSSQTSDLSGLPDLGQVYRDDQTHRRLKSRHIQLIGIGGTIGTSLFVQIGSALTKGGPANLLLGFTIWSSFIFAPKWCRGFRYQRHLYDLQTGFCAGYNNFGFLVFLIPFEITAFN
ncbi:hypothetical protein MPER_09885, partial [Moniliophthora perniciosa FA553]